MGQLNFAANYPYPIGGRSGIVAVKVLFFAFNFYDSISFNTINLVIVRNNSNSRTISASLGLYSVTGSTLSLANSAAGTWTNHTNPGSRYQYLSFSTISATQNISPGTWYFGLLASTAGSNCSYGGLTANPANAVQGGFIGGEMTATTNALPASYATSDLDITGRNALIVPYIIVSA